MTAPATLGGGLVTRNFAKPPSYAGTNKNPFDVTNSRYNIRSSNKFNTRMAIGSAVAGVGVWDCAFVGASLELGFNGSGLTQDTSKQWPTQFQLELASMLGGVATMEGVVPTGGQNDRWTLTGGASNTAAPAFIFCAGAGTAQITVKGTEIWVTFWNANTQTTTITVDGGAPVNLVPAGGNTFQTVQVATGLANANHVVLWTCAAGSNTLGAVTPITGTKAAPTAGFRFHNLCLGGSSWAFGTQYTNWSDHTSQGVSQGYLSDSRFKYMSDMGFVPQTWFIGGTIGNDALHSVPVATAVAGLTDVLSRIPNLANGNRPDIFFVNGWNVTPISATAFAPYQAAMYAQADLTDASAPNGRGLWDWCDIIGGLNNGITQGAIGPDNIHPTYGNMEAFGKAVALAFLA